MDEVSLTDDQKPAALAALYNASQPLGLGFIHYTPTAMTIGEAAAILHGQQYFDYLNGRVMKLDFGRSPMSLRLYDRDNGSGAGASALRAAKIIEE